MLEILSTISSIAILFMIYVSITLNINSINYILYKKSIKDKYMTIILKRPLDRYAFYSYVNNYLCFKGSGGNLINNNFTIASNNNPINTNLNNKVFFYDPNLNIEGYFLTKKLKYMTQKHGSDPNKEPRYIDSYCTKIYILKTDNKSIDVYQIYLSFIDKSHVTNKLSYIIETQDYRVSHPLMKKDAIRILKDTNILSKTLNLSLNEKIYMDPFFCKEKDHLWAFLKNKLFYVNETERYKIPKINIALSGPPGSGKSSFLCRLAICLNRHIVEINMKNFTLSSLYESLGIYESKFCILTYVDLDDTVKHLIYNKHNPQKNSKDVMDITDLINLCKGNIYKSQCLSLSIIDNLDEIQRICPELFYSGRLEVIRFGYVTVETLQDISMFYFKKRIIKRIPSTMKISTSYIIQIAIESETFEQFEIAFFKLF